MGVIDARKILADAAEDLSRASEAPVQTGEMEKWTESVLSYSRRTAGVSPLVRSCGRRTSGLTPAVRCPEFSFPLATSPLFD
jgi:hypothetical protein